MQKVFTAAGVQVKGFWANLYAKALQGRDINSLIRSGGASAATTTTTTTVTATAQPAASGKKE